MPKPSKFINYLKESKRIFIWFTFCLLYWLISDFYEGIFQGFFNSTLFIIGLPILVYIGLYFIRNHKIINIIWLMLILILIYFATFYYV